MFVSHCLEVYYKKNLKEVLNNKELIKELISEEIKKDTNERDIEKLYILISNIKGFNKFFKSAGVGRFMIKKMCQYINLEVFYKGDIIFKQGDSPNYFYGILNGNINIVKTNKHENKNNSLNLDYIDLSEYYKNNSTNNNNNYVDNSNNNNINAIRKSNKRNTINSNFNYKYNIKKTNEMNKHKNSNISINPNVCVENILNTKNFMGKIINNICEEDCFGERELINLRQRSYTAIASEDTFLFSLQKKYFKQTLLKQMLKLEENKVDFIGKILNLKKDKKIINIINTIFKQSNKVNNLRNINNINYSLFNVTNQYIDNYLNDLTNKIVFKSYKKDEYIYKENDISDSIYILYKGECTLTKEIKFNYQNKKKINMLNLNPGAIFGGEFLLSDDVKKNTKSAVSCNEFTIVAIINKNEIQYNKNYLTMLIDTHNTNNINNNNNNNNLVNKCISLIKNYNYTHLINAFIENFFLNYFIKVETNILIDKQEKCINAFEHVKPTYIKDKTHKHLLSEKDSESSLFKDKLVKYLVDKQIKLNKNIILDKKKLIKKTIYNSICKINTFNNNDICNKPQEDKLIKKSRYNKLIKNFSKVFKSNKIKGIKINSKSSVEDNKKQFFNNYDKLINLFPRYIKPLYNNQFISINNTNNDNNTNKFKINKNIDALNYSNNEENQNYYNNNNNLISNSPNIKTTYEYNSKYLKKNTNESAFSDKSEILFTTNISNYKNYESNLCLKNNILLNKNNFTSYNSKNFNLESNTKVNNQCNINNNKSNSIFITSRINKFNNKKIKFKNTSIPPNVIKSCIVDNLESSNNNSFDSTNKTEILNKTNNNTIKDIKNNCIKENNKKDIFSKFNKSDFMIKGRNMQHMLTEFTKGSNLLKKLKNSVISKSINTLIDNNIIKTNNNNNNNISYSNKNNDNEFRKYKLNNNKSYNKYKGYSKYNLINLGNNNICNNKVYNISKSDVSNYCNKDNKKSLHVDNSYNINNNDIKNIKFFTRYNTGKLKMPLITSINNTFKI